MCSLLCAATRHNKWVLARNNALSVLSMMVMIKWLKLDEVIWIMYDLFIWRSIALRSCDCLVEAGGLLPGVRLRTLLLSSLFKYRLVSLLPLIDTPELVPRQWVLFIKLRVLLRHQIPISLIVLLLPHFGTSLITLSTWLQKLLVLSLSHSSTSPFDASLCWVHKLLLSVYLFIPIDQLRTPILLRSQWFITYYRLVRRGRMTDNCLNILIACLVGMNWVQYLLMVVQSLADFLPRGLDLLQFVQVVFKLD